MSCRIIYSHLVSYHPDGVYIVGPGRPTSFRHGVGKDGRIAKAGDPSGTIFVNQDVYLAHEVNVNRVTQTHRMGGAYRLEVAMDDS